MAVFKHRYIYKFAKITHLRERTKLELKYFPFFCILIHAAIPSLNISLCPTSASTLFRINTKSYIVYVQTNKF